MVDCANKRKLGDFSKDCTKIISEKFIQPHVGTGLRPVPFAKIYLNQKVRMENLW